MKRFILGIAAVLTLACGNWATAEPVLGPGNWVGRVDAGRSRFINESFVGGRRAVVRIAGDGSTDVDVFVYDENGNLVASGVGPTDREYVTFTPRWTGRFTTEVRNLGNTWNRVLLLTS